VSELEDVNTVDQVAAYLHLEPRKVAQLARQRKIGSVKEGATVLITREDVVEYLAANRRAPLPPNPFGFTDATLRRIQKS
jgi:excisionase family DNA binding protein